MTDTLRGRRVAESVRRLAEAGYDATRGPLAAIATLLAGVVVGFIGFLRYTEAAASRNTELMLELAGRSGGEDLSLSAPVALTMLSAITFALATPAGWLATYLTLTGLVRAVAAAVDERRGDPIVGLARRAIAHVRARRREARHAAGLAALAGPEVPDRVVPAARFGIDGAELVIVASRPKPEWTPGTVLDCGDRWLCVGEASQRSLPVGLRTLYPLADMPAAAAFRRVVPYELPRQLG